MERPLCFIRQVEFLESLHRMQGMVFMKRRKAPDRSGSRRKHLRDYGVRSAPAICAVTLCVALVLFTRMAEAQANTWEQTTRFTSSPILSLICDRSPNLPAVRQLILFLSSMQVRRSKVAIGVRAVTGRRRTGNCDIAHPAENGGRSMSRMQNRCRRRNNRTKGEIK